MFGLPFDAVSEDQALGHLQRAARLGHRCLLSTPNLSFAAGCAEDADFRASVIHSDLSTADGAPIVWLSRLLGAPLPERVTGSNLFERMAVESVPPISVYLFGGPDGVAERAAQQLASPRTPGVTVAGWCSPGFASLDTISGPAVTDSINAVGPQFVLVALGARKGQAWIERNWPQLNAPVISHLGAVINFVAGTVTRAPLWVQRAGLEWLWRIKEEPDLWRRYWNDGQRLMRYLVSGALPWALALRRGRLGGTNPRAPLTVSRDHSCGMCGLHGAAVNGVALSPVRQLFAECCRAQTSLQLDLRGLTQIGTGFVALLQLFDSWHRQHFGRGCITHCGGPVRRALRWAAADHLLDGQPAGPAVTASSPHQAVALGASGAYSPMTDPSRNSHGDDKHSLAEPRAAHRR